MFGDVLDNPKMRGLKQMFISLYLYNNNKFIDGKKVEWAHQIGKVLQTRHNNFKNVYKTSASNGCFDRLSLIYLINGGRWGPRWQYSLGPKAINLKDPDKAHKPHPALCTWMIDCNKNQMYKIKVTQCYSDQTLPRNYWNNVLLDESLQKLNQILRLAFHDPTFEIDQSDYTSQCSFKRIKCMHFQSGNCSFAVNFSQVDRDQHAKCLVKINRNYVMEFNTAVRVKYMNLAPVLLCKGTYWESFDGLDDSTWINNGFGSLKWIDKNDGKIGWNFLTNINEPVFLIHNCVQLKADLQKKMPNEFAKLNQYDWIQNKCYWSHRLHEWKRTSNVSDNIDLPCGPEWICKRHTVAGCQQCQSHSGVFPTTKWKLKWHCNVHKDPHFWVLDSANGLVMTLMKSTHKIFSS